MSNSFDFFWVFKVVLINMIAILMMSAKLVTLYLLQINIFWNKDYDDIISVHDVTKKFLSHDSNYIVDVVMWAKFGNSRISVREVFIILIL